MISRRGVAKKRREYKPGVRTAKCSPAVAVAQQSWRSGNHFWRLSGQPPRALVVRQISRCHYCPAINNPETNMITTARHPTSTRDSGSGRITRAARARFARAKASTRPRQAGGQTARHSHLTSNVFERYRVFFVRLALFAPVLVTQRPECEAHGAILHHPYITTEQRRTRFIASGLVADRMRGRVVALIKRLPYASQ